MEINRPGDTTKSLVSRLFTAQTSKPKNLKPVQTGTLSPFQRVLLVTDGTVTQVLEAYMGERVDIVLLDQWDRLLPADHPWLEAGSGEPAIDRRVLLKGNDTGQIYVYAASTLVQQRLPEDVQVALGKPGAGLGRVLAHNQMETYRDRLWCGIERVDQKSEAGRYLAAEFLLSRTYRIFARGRPLMLITEKFPLPPTSSPWEQL